jgi:exopolyphosphatase/guanosine-5'-triphosphate,3'-diphosphate pyrophosphatase
MKRVAVVDIGSNAVRGTVAEVLGSTAMRVIADERIRTRLASGLLATGRLAEDRIAASLDAVGHMVALASTHGATAVRAVATAAVRSADNGAEFIERVERETGVAVEVIDGRREAELALASAAANFDLSGRVCVADIGGGSLEVVLASDGSAETIVSLPLGAVTVTARFGSFADPPASPEIAQTRSAVRRELEDALGPSPRPARLAVCSGGTITSLVGAAAARTGASPLDVHGVTVPLGEIEAVAAEVAALPIEERGSIPGIPPYRAETVLAGSLVMMELFDLLGTRTIAANRRGIREGLLLEMAGLSTPGDPA